MSDIVFISKVDFWLALVLWGSSFLTIAAPFWQWKQSEDGSLIQSVILMIVLLPFIALMLMPLFGTKYTLTDSQLLINNGFSTNRIELADITYITPTRNASSAPALSLDRLKITYKNKKVLISPKDKPRFYREIQSRNSNIMIVENNSEIGRATRIN